MSTKTPTSTSTNVMPFPADPPPALPDAIDTAYTQAVAEFDAERKAHYDAAYRDAEVRYDEDLAKQKRTWVKEYLADHYFPLKSPYRGKPPVAVFRMTRPYDTRIEDLIAAGQATGDPTRSTELFGQALLCWLYRRNSRATVNEVKSWLGQYITTEGDASIEVASQEHVSWSGIGPFPKPVIVSGETDDTGVHAEAISEKLKSILREVSSEIVVEHGRVLFVSGQREVPMVGSGGTRYQWVLASASPSKFPPEQW